MNGRIILAGLIIFGIGLIASIPVIILGIAGSPIKGEGDAGIIILDTLEEGLDNPQVDEIVDSGKNSIRILDSIPKVLMFFGVFILIAGFFIP